MSGSIKIPEKFIPLGPESAFKLEKDEFLPMWIHNDSSPNTPTLRAVSGFDGDNVLTQGGLIWRYCMPMEGHPIPEAALLKKPSRRLTNREVGELCKKGWDILFDGDIYYGYYPQKVDPRVENNFANVNVSSMRAPNSDQWRDPTTDLLETARAEALK